MLAILMAFSGFISIQCSATEFTPTFNLAEEWRKESLIKSGR